MMVKVIKTINFDKKKVANPYIWNVYMTVQHLILASLACHDLFLISELHGKS